MDVFYEESSIVTNAKKEKRKYNILNVIANIFLGLLIFDVILTLSILPWVLGLFFGVWFLVTWLVLRKFRARYNVNYDYTFVSGELRIARVFNVNKRKLLVRINAEDIVQLGDVDNTAFEGLRADPNTKMVVCTSNDIASEGKFFMYILSVADGKKLYVLECRETLLMHMLRFVKRTVLESDYVSQDKKRKV